MICRVRSTALSGLLNSEGRVISRGVTSCAGMTAQHVLLAQTKIGFLTGGRGYSFQELSPEDKQSQREEAFARATVALTRAQRFCFIMCPLDMKGIIGAATVVGCLQHGVGICDERSTGRLIASGTKSWKSCSIKRWFELSGGFPTFCNC